MVPWCPQAPPVHRLDGFWRYERRPGRGIALSFGRGSSPPPWPAAPAPRSAREPAAPAPPPPAPPAHASGVRVLCYCGTSFHFAGQSGVCPHCAQLAEWPTMGVVEREMRSDLDSLLAPYDPSD